MLTFSAADSAGVSDPLHAASLSSEAAVKDDVPDDDEYLLTPSKPAAAQRRASMVMSSVVDPVTDVAAASNNSGAAAAAVHSGSGSGSGSGSDGSGSGSPAVAAIVVDPIGDLVEVVVAVAGTSASPLPDRTMDKDGQGGPAVTSPVEEDVDDVVRLATPAGLTSDEASALLFASSLPSVAGSDVVGDGVEVRVLDDEPDAVGAGAVSPAAADVEGVSEFVGQTRGWMALEHTVRRLHAEVRERSGREGRKEGWWVGTPRAQLCPTCAPHRSAHRLLHFSTPFSRWLAADK